MKLRYALRHGAAVACAAGARNRFVHAQEHQTAGAPGSSNEVWRPGQREVPVKPRWPGPAAVLGEPEYTRAQVSQRDGSSTSRQRVWVTYRDGVYDVTEFKLEHPGGHYIDLAAGGPVDAFWQNWTWHHHSTKVPALLEKLRVGKLKDWDASACPPDDGSPYADDPARGGVAQRIFFNFPYCSETRPKHMAKSYLTSADDFFVRNHAPVPHNDGDDHIVTFQYLPKGFQEPEEIAEMSLGQLRQNFGPVTVNSILQCSGNRAAENLSVNGANGFTGTPFATITVGLLGNAQWHGARLSSVLQKVYPPTLFEEGTSMRHVMFEGKDEYGTSVPLGRCADPQYDALLCWGMNGAPLPPDHGSPLRALLPGITGARNVKWLTTVTIAEEESAFCWQSKYYKDGPQPAGQSIQELPTAQSIVLSAVHHGPGIAAEGIAYSGSGRGISAVEVSCDEGRTWHPATMLVSERPPDDSHGDYGWVRWRVEIVDSKSDKIWCRATDGNGNRQKEIGDQRNGYLYDGYHKKTVGVISEWDEGAMPANWKP